MKWKVILNFFNNKAKSLSLKARNAKDKRNKIIYRVKSAAYMKVYRTIRDNYRETELVTNDRIDSLVISENMKNKIKYYLKHPDKIPYIKVAKVETKKKPAQLIQELTGFMGIGVSTAKALIKRGLTNTNQIRNKKYADLLSDQTKLYLSLKPVKKILHAQIKELEPTVTKLLKDVEMIIVGSYRRKTRFSRDVDVMVVSNDKKILCKLIEKLQSKLGKDNVFPYIIGKDKISVIIVEPGKSMRTTKKKSTKEATTAARSDAREAKKTKRKWDFFRTPVKDKWAMLLYSTGSQSHNIKMRNKAKRKGMLLNQTGLYDRETKELLSGKAKSEKFFFDKLDMKYLKPEERI